MLAFISAADSVAVAVGGDVWNSSLTPPATPTSPTSSSSQSASLCQASKEGSSFHVERPPERPPDNSEKAERPSVAASGWSLRSRRHRLSTRPVKRLFTPDIKKMLKGWLLRRRDNPYPSRAEKEALATRTGLTYMQVCNWFANWRRKLRDCGRPEDGVEASGGGHDGGHDGGEGGSAGDASWAHLIRRYNALAADSDAANGQEHFSISSSDSIWAADAADDRVSAPRGAGPSRSALSSPSPSPSPQQNASVSSTTSDSEATRTSRRVAPRECGDGSTSWPLSTSTGAKATPDDRVGQGVHGLGDTGSALEAALDTALETASSARSGSALLLSKWLESAARYQPSAAPATAKHSQKPPPGWGIASAAVEHTLEGRHREELDAAEALAILSSLHFR